MLKVISNNNLKDNRPGKQENKNKKTKIFHVK